MSHFLFDTAPHGCYSCDHEIAPAVTERLPFLPLEQGKSLLGTVIIALVVALLISSVKGDGGLR